VELKKAMIKASTTNQLPKVINLRLLETNTFAQKPDKQKKLLIVFGNGLDWRK
jgi:hypothetical protein